MEKSTKFKLQFGITFVLTMVLMLAAVELGWAQSSNDVYRTENFSINDDAKIDVKTSGGSIKVYGKNTDEVTVEMYVRKNGKYVRSGKADLDDWQITISEKNNVVTAHAERKSNKRWNFRNNNQSISFVVYAPKRSVSALKTSGGSIAMSNLDGNQNAKTSGGSIKVDNVNGNVNVNTSGGSISLDKIVGSVDAKTSGGRISAEDITGALDLNTSGGSISIENIDGDVEARTSGGSISAEITNPKNYVNLRTSGGSIKIEVPKGKGYDLDLDGSRVRADLTNFTGEYEKDEIVGSLNGGGTKIKAKTSGGTVRFSYF